MYLAGRAPAALAAAASLLAASACAPLAPTALEPPPAPAAQTQSSAPAVAMTVPRPVRKPAAPQPAALAALPGTPASLPAPTTALDSLDGLDQPATLALLGPPRQRVESPPATIWRYVTDSCELDVYFYLDLRTDEMRVLHYEARSQDHDAAERSQQRCYEQLASERRGSLEPTVSADRPR